jgi:SAM-dependent methyltransferase
VKTADGTIWLSPQQLVDRFVPNMDGMRVLDAGCGSGTHAQFPAGATIVGLDISRKSLERNPLVDERIVADLQTCRLPSSSFDVVICWFVLEHLDDPQAALIHLIDALAPGGVLILACPDPHSVKGLLTRLTPHSLHVWFYRQLLRHEHAGEDGHAPFRTVLSGKISPRAIRRLAASKGLTIKLETPFNIALAARRNDSSRTMRALGVALDFLCNLLEIITFGRYRGNLSEYSYVFGARG